MRQDTYLHLYEIGDLDEFFWSHTAWYAMEEAGVIAAMVLVYCGTDLPVILALEDANRGAARALLCDLIPSLPDRFYCHLSPGLEDVLRPRFRLEHHGRHNKMRLANPDFGVVPIMSGTTSRFLGPEDEKPLFALYSAGYPGNWFDRRMLETGKYVGLFADDRIIAVAGVHVYSAPYGVAVLGNITTHPDYRGRGAGAQATSLLCEDLMKTTRHVGLNVHSQNMAAIRCYEKIGFKFHSTYDEYAALRA